MQQKNSHYSKKILMTRKKLSKQGKNYHSSKKVFTKKKKVFKTT